MVDVQLQSWFKDIPFDTDFSLYNFPFGVYSIRQRETNQNHTAIGSRQRCCSRIGNYIIDLCILEEADIFHDIIGLQYNVFQRTTLNQFLQHPKAIWLAVRKRLMDLFIIRDDTTTSNPSATSMYSTLRNNIPLQLAALIPINSHNIQMVVPINIGDYTDFYSSREHATNVGIMFRGVQNALQPNWLHLPVGYHGRASTICISDTPIHRPCGQIEDTTTSSSSSPKSMYGPTQQLDFELEVAAVIGGPSNDMGVPLDMEKAKERIFGYVLMNDWSARDIQKWEYVPLGPFTSKNFATTISPWIVMVEALDSIPTSFVTQNDPIPLPYLQDPTYASYDVSLSVSVQGRNQDKPHIVCNTNFKHMYWNSAQQLVHHSVTGCIMKAGDLLGSGTISGASDISYGSMLELSWKGTKPVPIGDNNEVRTFLLDGDTITMNGYCVKSGGTRVGFGECRGTILPPYTVGTKIADNEKLVTKSSTDRFVDFTLYGYWRSSSTWRVRIALAAKSIPYKTVSIDLSKHENISQTYLELNPLGQVPLLECICADTGERVRFTQSLAIITFLDEAFPTRKSLIPSSDASQKASALAIVEVVNSSIQPWQNVFALEELAKQSDVAIQASHVAKTVNEKGLRSLEILIQNYRSQNPFARGPYSIGTFSPTIVDAYLVPQIYNARRFGVIVDDTTYPAVTAIDVMCSTHPWFIVSHPISQPDAIVNCNS